MIQTAASVSVFSPRAIQRSLAVLDSTNSDFVSVQGSDYLLCQLTTNKKLSTFERLPAELLEPILDEVSLVV